MKTDTQIFVPKMDAEKVIIREVDVDQVLAIAADHFKMDGSVSLGQYLGHTMNLGNVRYRMLDQIRRCECCKIVTTHAFLEYDFDNTDPAGKPIVVFNFYAETKDKPELQTSHLIKMTNNKRGVVCATCGFILDQLRCSIFDVQQIMFNAYRAYRSSLTLRISDKALEPMFSELVKNQRLIDNVESGMLRTQNDGAKEAMQQKIVTAEARIKDISEKLECLRTTAQQTGVAVDAQTVADFMKFTPN